MVGLVLAAMSRFATGLRDAGHRVILRTLDDPLEGVALVFGSYPTAPIHRASEHGLLVVLAW